MEGIYRIKFSVPLLLILLFVFGTPAAVCKMNVAVCYKVLRKETVYLFMALVQTIFLPAKGFRCIQVFLPSVPASRPAAQQANQRDGRAERPCVELNLESPFRALSAKRYTAPEVNASTSRK